MNPRLVLLPAMALTASLWTYACGDGGTGPPPSDPPRPTTVTVTAPNLELTAVEATVQLTAEVRDQNGRAMAGAAVSWSSGDPSVVTVNASGLAIAVANGGVTITATAGSASGTVTVTVAQRVATVAISPESATLVVGDTLRLASEATDANGHIVPEAEVSWVSGDTSVAVVDPSGLVTGVGEGNVEITATSSEVVGRASLTIATPAPATVLVEPDTVRLSALADTVRLAVEVRDQIGRPLTDFSVSWVSADTAVVSVDSTGLVTTMANGATTVSATAAQVSGEAVVTVTQSVRSVVLSPTADTVAVGDTLRLVAEAFDANGYAVVGAEFNWSSSNDSIAEVDDSGLVTAIDEGYQRSRGSATITATAGDARGTSQITVDSPDRAALVALYHSTDGPNWLRADNWLTDRPLRDWYGVGVAGDQVKGLWLSENGLAGPIPSEIAELTGLETLDLRWNHLAGEIPVSLGGLPHLRSLDLRSNDLAGPIPPELRNSSLTSLYLRYAGIAGELCVPDDPALVSWLAGFPTVPGASAPASFIPCERIAPTPEDGPSVRTVYAVPSDREVSEEYHAGIRRGIELLQWWFADRLDGATFSLLDSDPLVCRMHEPEAFYVEDAWVRVLEGVQHCAPVGYADKEYIWVVYADVWDHAPLEVVLESTRGEDCSGGRLGAGGSGLTMMGGWDLYGLITPRFRQCGWYTGVDRWIGGTGHELSHALGLPHPPGCDEGLPSCDWEALTFLGYGAWPHTFLREDEKAVLLASPFIR